MNRDGDLILPLGFIDALAAASSRNGVIETTAKWLPSIVEAERSSIALLIDDSHVAVAATGGPLILDVQHRYATNRSLMGAAIRSERLINVADLSTVDFDEVPDLLAAGLRSALVVPMMVAGRCLGTLNLGNAKLGYFDESHEATVTSIANLIASFINVHEAVIEREQLSMVDPLTGLRNRRAILAELETSYDLDDAWPSVLFLDLDALKTINDSHGHVIGDEVLRTVARELTTLARECDSVGRLGGDEFLVVTRNDPDGVAAERLAVEITDALSSPIKIDRLRLAVRASVGIASPDRGTASASDLLIDADVSMYLAKASGTTVEVADTHSRQIAARRAVIARDFDDAAMDGAVTMHLQPIRDLITHEILGAEALLRWNHPVQGWLPPDMVVSQLESSGQTELLTAWSVAETLRVWSQVRQALPWFGDKGVSMNFTANQLRAPGLVRAYTSAVDHSGLRRQDLIVEVVESGLIEVGDAAEAVLQELAAAGAVIALDDFGTGHNALGYLLTRFPVHALKFDRILIAALDEHESARTILRGLATIADDLRVGSLAEGIESAAEAELCREAGVNAGQGWFFGRPMPVHDFIALALADGPPDSWARRGDAVP